MSTIDTVLIKEHKILSPFSAFSPPIWGGSQLKFRLLNLEIKNIKSHKKEADWSWSLDLDLMTVLLEMLYIIVNLDQSIIVSLSLN